MKKLLTLTKKILVSILIFLPYILYSQIPEITFDKFRISQGTQPQDISNMCQDNYGFLWIGSDNGVDKFDGYVFLNYRSSETDKNSLCNNAVGHIFFDSFNTLWVASQEGLNRFSIADENFTHYFHTPNDKNSIGDNLISPFYEDKNRTLWVGTYGGVSRFNREANSFTTFSHDPANPNSLSHNTVSSIYMDRSGNMWIGTWGGGLNKFNPQTGKWTCYRHDPNNPKSISHDFIRKVFEDKSGHFWIGTTGGGFNEFNPKSETFTTYKHDPKNPASLSDNFITSMMEDDYGNIWLGTFNAGLNIFNVKTKEFTHIRFDQNNPNSIISDCVTSIYRDRSGIIFVGTSRGINQIRFLKNTFRFHTPSNGTSEKALNDRDIRSICEDHEGNLWIGTYRGGLNKLDRKTGRYTYYTFQMEESLMSDRIEINGIIEDSEGNLWLSTVGSGLIKFYRDGSIKNFSTNIFNTSNNFKSTYLFQDRRGILWIGYPNGVISKFDPKTEKFSHIKLGESQLDKQYIDEINYIIEDKNENKWIALRHKGLCKIDAKTGEVQQIRSEMGNKNSLSDNDVKALCLSDDDILWIGTTNGFNRFDLKTGEFKHYFVKDGLPDIIIRSITMDNKGILWLGTHKGLSRFDPVTERFNNYDERDGVFIGQFSTNSYYSKRTGNMYLCGYNGFMEFNPDSIRIDTIKPKVYITGIEIHGQKVSVGQKILGSVLLEKSILLTDKLELNHRQNNFAVHFISLHYKMPDRNQCAYKLEGYDQDWHTSVDNRIAKYMNLPSGTYTFRVKGSNSDGYWNEIGDSLAITVYPPWWKSWWMFIVYILASVVGILLYIHRRTEKHKKDKIILQRLVEQRTEEVASQNVQLAEQTEKLKEMSQMRSRFYTYLSHEFRTPLTMIMGPLQQILSGSFSGDLRNLHKIMLRNTKRLLHLIDELLDLSKLERGSMELKASFNKVNPFIKRIVLSFEIISEQKSIKLSFIESKQDIKCYFDRDKLEKVIYNLISNAIKYTPDHGEISVTVDSDDTNSELSTSKAEKYNEGWVKIIVKDNGIGIREEHLPYIFEQFYQDKSSAFPSKKGWGIGLALVKELIELHHGKIHVKSIIGKGTEFSILLPLGKHHLSKDEIIEKDYFEFIKSVDTSKESIDSDQTSSDLIEVKDLLLDEVTGSEESEYKDAGRFKRYTILIVEDQQDIRQYVHQLLQKDYLVIEATNGKEGIEKTFTSMPDLIVSDIMMPILDGYELCRRLKTDIITCHIPIILLTAKTSDVGKIEGLEKGADDYLIKPFNPVELKKRIENLIELRQQLQRKYRQEVLLNPNVVIAKSMDERFLEKIRSIIESNISSPDLTVEKLYTELGISRSNFHSKFRALTGQSANQYIRTYRLKRALQLIEQHAGNIAQIAYDVGFTSTSYFTKCFKYEFGKIPSDYIT
ncbi:MAG: response regulator [Bacteroidales bacterium]|nr:MAG: response regulator [Bacteroidales bacterium]